MTLDRYFNEDDHKKLAKLLQKAYDASYPSLSLKEANELLSEFAYVSQHIVPKIKNLSVGEIKLHEPPKEEPAKKKTTRKKTKAS